MNIRKNLKNIDEEQLFNTALQPVDDRKQDDPKKLVDSLFKAYPTFPNSAPQLPPQPQIQQFRDA